MSTKDTKVFTWSSEQEGKQEYKEWESYFQAECSKKGVGYCVDNQFSNLFAP